MKLFLNQSNITKTREIETWLRDSLESLLPLMKIEVAQVRLECVPEASPRYRASAVLVVPGPDLKAEVCDHTERTAVAKLMAKLRAQVVERAEKRLQRLSGRSKRLPLQLHG